MRGGSKGSNWRVSFTCSWGPVYEWWGRPAVTGGLVPTEASSFTAMPRRQPSIHYGYRVSNFPWLHRRADNSQTVRLPVLN